MPPITMPILVNVGDTHEDLTIDLAVVLNLWHKRAYGRPNSPITDPIRLLGKLRSRVLITREQYQAACNLFVSPESLTPARRRLLQEFLYEGLEQATVEVRRLSDPEKATIDLLLGRGVSPQVLSRRFGIPATAIKQDKPRDARQVEHREICSQMVGGALCRS